MGMLLAMTMAKQEEERKARMAAELPTEKPNEQKEESAPVEETKPKTRGRRKTNK